MNTKQFPNGRPDSAFWLWDYLEQLKIQLARWRKRLDWLAILIAVIKRMRFPLLFAIAASLAMLTEQGKEIIVNSFGSLLQGLVFVGSCLLAAISVWYTSRLLFYTWKDDTRVSAHSRAWAMWLITWMPGALGMLVMLIPAVGIWMVADRIPKAIAVYPRWFSAVLLVLSVVFFSALMTRKKILAGRERSVDRTGLEYHQLSPWAGRFFLSMLMLNAIAIAAFAAFPLLPISLGIGSGVVVMLAAGLAIVTGSLVSHVADETRLPILSGLFVAAMLFSLWNDNHEITLIDNEQLLRGASLDAQVPARETLDQYLAAKLEARIRARKAYCARRASNDCDPRATFVVVAAEGGGVRAAAWTALVLSKIDQHLRGAESAENFSDQLVAISGVSGGSLGGALYLAALQRSKDEPWRLARKFFKTDLLTPLLANTLFVDTPQRFLPVTIGNRWVPDRGATFERTIERAWADAAHLGHEQNVFSANLDHVWRDQQHRIPLLLANATIVASGERMVQSAVSLRQVDANTHDVKRLAEDHQSQQQQASQQQAPLQFDIGRDDRTFVGAYDANDCLLSTDPHSRPLGMPLSAMVHNSARFTWLSPAGRYGKRSVCHGVRLVDGGYFENSGTATADDIVSAVNAKYPGQVKAVVVQIRNEPIDERDDRFDCGYAHAAKTETRAGPTLAISEMLDPLYALFAGRAARGEQAKLSMKRRICGEHHRSSPVGESADVRSDGVFVEFSLLKRPGVQFPLHWAIAQDTLDQMEKQFVDPCATNRRALNFLLQTLTDVEQTVTTQSTPHCGISPN